MLQVARQPPIRHPHSLQHASKQLRYEEYAPEPRTSRSTTVDKGYPRMTSTSNTSQSSHRSGHQDRDRRGSASLVPAQQYVEGSRFKHPGSGRRESSYEGAVPLTRSNLVAHDIYQQGPPPEKPRHRHHKRSSSIAVPEQYAEMENSHASRLHRQQLSSRPDPAHVVYTDVPRRVKSGRETSSTAPASSTTSLSSRRNSEPVVLPVRSKSVEDSDEELGVETWEPDPRDPARYVRRIYRSSVSTASGRRSSDTSDDTSGGRRSRTGKHVRFAEADSLILL